MDKLQSTSVFSGYARDWAGFSVVEITDYELISLSIATGQDAGFAKAMKSRFGRALPAPGTSIAGSKGRLIWTAPGQYLAMISAENDRADEALQAAIGASGYAVLQSDGWGVLQISGDRVFDVLERFIPLDLRNSPDTFAARASAHHIAAICVRKNADWVLLTPRTSAAGFLQSLEHAADNVLAV